MRWVPNGYGAGVRHCGVPLDHAEVPAPAPEPPKPAKPEEPLMVEENVSIRGNQRYEVRFRAPWGARKPAMTKASIPSLACIGLPR